MWCTRCAADAPPLCDSCRAQCFAQLRGVAVRRGEEVAAEWLASRGGAHLRTRSSRTPRLPVLMPSADVFAARVDDLTSDPQLRRMLQDEARAGAVRRVASLRRRQ